MRRVGDSATRSSSRAASRGLPCVRCWTAAGSDDRAGRWAFGSRWHMASVRRSGSHSRSDRACADGRPAKLARLGLGRLLGPRVSIARARARPSVPCHADVRHHPVPVDHLHVWDVDACRRAGASQHSCSTSHRTGCCWAADCASWCSGLAGMCAVARRCRPEG